MRIVFAEKVRFRIPGTDRLVWAVVVAQNQGLALLFVRKPDEGRSDTLTIAAENVSERVFEQVNASEFPIEDLVRTTAILGAIAEDVNGAEMKKLLQPEDLF